MEQKIINIKWKTGEMEFSVRDFLDLFPSPEKCSYMADLAKRSDRDFGTDAVSEMLIYCSQLLDSHKTSAQDWEYRRKTSVYAAHLIVPTGIWSCFVRSNTPQIVSAPPPPPPGVV